MIRSIVLYPAPVLRAKCRPVEEITDDIRALAEDMLETMVEANGVGLAAPQVGVDLQLAVVDVSHVPECISYLLVNGQPAGLAEIMPLKFVNPVLTLRSPRVTEQEGCLSFPELRAMVTRHERVIAKLTTLDGSRLEIETDGLLSRAIQHETDHLHGRLFIDRLTASAKVSLQNRLKWMREDYGKRP